MSEAPGKKMSRPKDREERLAAKLRENLRRRKAQSRAQTGVDKSESDDNGVSKQNPDS